VPNRRRRRLSTAMSAVAALAVASPAAVIAVSNLSDSAKPPTQHRQFVQAAMITDLPGELMSALSQGLSQFGVNLPPMPTGLLTGSGASTPTTLTSPGLGTSPLTTPALGASPLATPGLGTAPLATPGVGTTPLTTPNLGNAPTATPGLGLPNVPATLPDAALTNPALTNPALTSPLGQVPGVAATGLTTPPAGAVDPALASPISNAGAHRLGWIPPRVPTRCSVIRRWRPPLRPPAAAAGCSATCPAPPISSAQVRRSTCSRVF
jgi:hypothetical protein